MSGMQRLNQIKKHQNMAGETKTSNTMGSIIYMSRQEIIDLPKGPVRIERIQQQIKRADRKGNLGRQLYYRFLLVNEYVFRGDGRQVLPVAEEYGQLFEESSSVIQEDVEYRRWYIRVVDHTVCSFILNGAYSIPQCVKWFETFYQLTQRFGMGERLYWSSSFRFWKAIDWAKSQDALEHMWKTPRDALSDCEGCEFSRVVVLHLEREEKEQADALLQQYLDQHNQQLDEDCDATPPRIYDAYLLYELRHQEREGWEKRAEELAQKLEDCLEDFEEDMGYYVTLLYDKTQRNLSQAVEEFSQYAGKIPLKRCDDFVGELCFYSVGAEMFRRVGQNQKSIQLNLPQNRWYHQPEGRYDCKKMEEDFLKKASQLAQQLDERNGTDYYTQMIQKFYGGCGRCESSVLTMEDK